jgi:tetratricopeptide (TPR) repeat protein
MTSSQWPGSRRGRRQALSEPADPAAFSRALDEAAAHFRAGRLDAAAQVYRRLEREAPGDLRAPYSLAVIDLNQGRLERARSRLEALGARAPDFAPVQHNLAAVRQQLGDWAGAAQAYARAVDLQPAAAESRVGLAGALAALGRSAEAIAQNRILAAEPLQRWAALTRIALVDPAAIEDADLAAMQAAAADPATETGARIGLRFALGEVLDDRGREAEAFDAYEAGNRALRARLDVAGAARANTQAFDEVRAAATPELIARLKGQGSASAAPIFIVGFPRSGSTLVEQILASHPQVQGLGETGVLPRLLEAGYPKTAAAARDLAARYLETMRVRGWDGRSRFVDKTLEGYLHAGAIGALFPNAVILHSLRDSIDTGFACWRQLFARGEETLYDLADSGAEYVRYRTIMDHWAALTPGRAVEVRYEALVTEPEPTIRALLAAAGLAWDPAVLDFHKRRGAVATASASQVRRPIYASSVRRWARHAERLQPLITALGPYAKV